MTSPSQYFFEKDLTGTPTSATEAEERKAAQPSKPPQEVTVATTYGLVPGALYRIDLSDCCVSGSIFQARFVGVERKRPEGISVEMEHLVFDCCEFTTWNQTYFERIDES